MSKTIYEGLAAALKETRPLDLDLRMQWTKDCQAVAGVLKRIRPSAFQVGRFLHTCGVPVPEEVRHDDPR